jgi:hypothetical protein
MKRKQNPDAYNGFGDHGGYMNAKITKLEEQFSSLQNSLMKKSNIFEGKKKLIFFTFSVNSSLLLFKAFRYTLMDGLIRLQVN